MANQDKVTEVRKKAIERHDVDSSIFQGSYEDFKLGKYTNEFIYGRYQIFDEIDKVLTALPKGSRILDLGCGTGHFSNYMRQRGYEVVGLDPSTKMLDFARKNFPDITFVEGISSALPFEENTFDLIISIEVLRYLHPKDVEDSYTEVYRTLKKDGIFFVTHVNRFATDGYFFFYHMQYYLNKLKGKQYHNCYFTTPGKEESLMKRAGFRDINTIGRMFGSIRIGYKLGKSIGRAWAKVVNKINSKEHFTSNPGKAVAGHLIITAKK
jgi:ubiquinone/menaquinone biosynthesis C-methylase UbiE